MISQKCDNKWAKMNLDVVKHTFPWVYLIKTFDPAWHTAKTYINTSRLHGQCMDTLTCLQMHPFVAEDTNFKLSSCLAKKKTTAWLVFGSASIFFFPGGWAWWGERENVAQCSEATSAVCLMTFGRCRAHMHLCGRLSASFTGSAS